METIVIKDGVFYIDGKRKYLISADYPYYRDKVENWMDRLIKLKEAGISIVTFYVPWRHHLINDKNDITIDFEGKTYTNRNVKYFIELCKIVGLLALIKPGPFIHAETNYDGLPDCISPSECKSIEAMLNSKYEQVPQGKPLPAPLDSKFNSLVRCWFEMVNKELIIPNIYPKGNIIAVQVLNEGMYSNINLSPLDYDYSKSSIRFFRQFLMHKYNSIKEYNVQNGTKYSCFMDIEAPVGWEKPENLKDLLRLVDWSQYQAQYIKKLYDEYGSYLDNNIPHLANICSYISKDSGLDYWLTRVQPELWTDTVYGFTNWVGAVAYDETAYNKYLTLSKRKKGPNLEENWGFSILYDYKYKYPVIPFFQTILAIANGASGFNVYTGVSTAHWDENIDNCHDKPYPDCSPITHEGEKTYKYKVLKLLTKYMNKYADEILSSSTNIAAVYGLYLPYSYISSWNNSEDDWSPLGVYPPRCGFKGLDAFQRNMRLLNYDFEMVNLQYSDLSNLLNNPVIVLVGGFFMEESVQHILVQYVKNGGRLVLLREVPQYNERFEECSILKQELFSHTTADKLTKVVVDGFSQVIPTLDTLKDVPGKIIYTAGSKPVGYEIEHHRGSAYFVSFNPFETNLNEHSELFLHLMKSIVKEYDVLTDDVSTQVWCHNNANSDIKHIFVLSKSSTSKEHLVHIKNKDGSYDPLKIKLCAKSAAILRIKNGDLTSFLVKGINEFEGVSEITEIEYKNQRLSSKAPADILFIKDGKEFIVDTLNG
jgi:beta-galactosidase